MRILYYDCFAGVSGDMNLGALLDLGVPEAHLRGELDKLGLTGFELVCTRDRRRSVSGTRVEVRLEAPTGHGHVPHRGLPEIRALVEASTLPRSVKTRSLAIFSRLAEAEAKVHGIAVERVHFHEVGAVDAIVDIVGAAIALEWLGPEEIWCGPVELGGGTVRCAHGTFPVPAPATAEILASRGVPVSTGRVPFEATTPTGAAILAACVDRFVDRATFVPRQTGYGLGSREAEVPNALRVFLAQTGAAAPADDVQVEGALVVECTLDDMPGEAFGAAMEELFAVGARDVTFTPVVMKKSRPGTTITVLCTDGVAPAVRDALFRHTTTLGVRQHAVEKYVLDRDVVSVRLGEDTIRVKRAYYRGQVVRAKPEHEDCRRAAGRLGVSTAVVAARALEALREQGPPAT